MSAKILTFGFVVGAIGFVSQAFAGIGIQDLKVHCEGTFKIESTHEPFYVPENCNGIPTTSLIDHICGRRVVSPAEGGFKAKVSFKPTSEECATLKTKYGVTLDEPFETVFYVKAPISLEQAKHLAKDLTGLVESWKVEQSFYYKNQEGYLPFFPVLHNESVSLEGSVSLPSGDVVSFSLPFAVDSQKIYGAKELKSLNQNEALFIEQQAVIQFKQQFQKGGWMGQFVWALVTAPTVPHTKLETLKGLMEWVSNKPFTSRFFEFHVGGSEGVRFAEKLIELTHVPGLLNEQDKKGLLLNYPGLLLISAPSRNTSICFAADAALMGEFLTQVLDAVSEGSLPHGVATTYLLDDVADVLSGKTWAPCASTLVFPQNVSKAEHLKNLLSKKQ